MSILFFGIGILATVTCIAVGGTCWLAYRLNAQTGAINVELEKAVKDISESHNALINAVRGLEHRHQEIALRLDSQEWGPKTKPNPFSWQAGGKT